MRVDTALVRELAELLTANDLNEIEVEDGDRKIKVRRDAPTAYVAAPAPVASAAPPLPRPQRPPLLQLLPLRKKSAGKPLNRRW